MGTKMTVKAAVILMVVLVIGMFIGAGAWGQGPGHGFYSGNDFLGLSPLLRAGYIAGVSDTMNFLHTGTGKGLNLIKATIFFSERTKGMRVGQVNAIAEKYLQDNPQHRHGGMAQLVYLAVGTDK